MTRILIVEDNEDLARGLANNLEIEGFETEVARDGTTGLARARESSPDLVILDLMFGQEEVESKLLEGFHPRRELPQLTVVPSGKVT